MAALPTWDRDSLQLVSFHRPYWLAVNERLAALATDAITAPSAIGGSPFNCADDAPGAYPSIRAMQTSIDAMIESFANTHDYPTFDGEPFDHVVCYTKARFYELVNGSTGFTRWYGPRDALVSDVGFFEAGDVIDKHIFEELRTAIGLLKAILVHADTHSPDGYYGSGNDANYATAKTQAEGNFAAHTFGGNVTFSAYSQAITNGSTYNTVLIRGANTLQASPIVSGMTADVDWYVAFGDPSTNPADHNEFDPQGDFDPAYKYLVYKFGTNTLAVTGTIVSPTWGGTAAPTWPTDNPSTDPGNYFLKGYSVNTADMWAVLNYQWSWT